MPDNTLDFEFLRTLREDAFGAEGSEDFKDLLKTYVDSSEKNLEQLAQLLVANNIPEATRMAHTLKGSSASVGAVKMSAVSKAMEFCLKGQGEPVANIPTLLENMKTEFAETRLALQKYLQSQD